MRKAYDNGSKNAKEAWNKLELWKYEAKNRGTSSNTR